MNLAAIGLLAACMASGAASDRPRAEELLAAGRFQGGLIVHLGCGDGRLTVELGDLAGCHSERSEESGVTRGKILRSAQDDTRSAQDDRVQDDCHRCVVRGLDGDPARVDAARQTIAARGLYGRVSVERWVGPGLPLADNLVNLLVVSGPADVSREEMLRVLCPNGTALFVDADGRQTGDKLVKPWPANIDQWTHWLHGPDGNPVAHDTVVGPPRQVQWWASPVWSRAHEKSPSLTGMVSGGGRLFYISDEGPADIGGPLPDRWTLVARDAFNGILLWKRPMPDWGWQAWSPKQPMNFRWGNPRFIHRRLVADGDRVYVTLGYSAAVSALDGATGRVLQVYEGTENACEILCHEGRLVLSVATEPKTAVEDSPPLALMAVDIASGRILWRSEPLPSLFDLGERGTEDVLKQGHLMIAAGAGHAFCVSREEILAFRLADGRLAWKVPRPPAASPDNPRATRVDQTKRYTNLGSLMVHDGRVFYAQPLASQSKPINDTPMTVLCLAADSGRELWQAVHGDWSYTTSLNVYAARDMIWVHSDPREAKYDLLGLNPADGKEQVRYDLSDVLTTKHHHRCYRNKATDNYLLMSKEGIEYVDLASGSVQPNRWIRGMCLYGVMPANGLLYVPPHACSCNPMTLLQGYWALAPRQDPLPETPEASRLETDPAFSPPLPRAESGTMGEGRGERKQETARATDPTRVEPLGKPLAEREEYVGPPGETAPAPVHKGKSKKRAQQPSTTSGTHEGREAGKPNVGAGPHPAAAPPPSPEGRGDRSDDWPAYRHDAQRSAATGCELGPKLASRWQTKLGGLLTAPVVADGRVYVGRRDAHEIVALDAQRGDVLWRFRTGGPIDTPPTFHQGLLLAGCSDGWVYCLQAADGRLCWRFQAAPAARDVLIESRLESAWPVHGSVLVRDNVAYVSAGRSSYLDGGMRFYALDPASGRVLCRKTLATEQQEQEAYSDGVLWDLLVCDAEGGLFMRHLRLDPNTLEVSRVGSWAFSGPQPGKEGHKIAGTLPVTDECPSYLRSGQGFLDDSLYGRTQCHLDGGEYCCLMCFDAERTYGFQFATTTGHYTFFTPGKEGYSLLAFDRSRPILKHKHLWEQRVPLRPYGVLLAGERLAAAGVPDVVPDDDPLASFEGRLGGRLMIFASETGEALSELKLDAPPVFDSLAAARGRLYLTDKAGAVRCFQ